MPRARHLGQDTLQPRLFIALTQPPNRGRITLQLKGHGLNACAFGDGQYHPCSLDLKPRQGATACNLFEDRLIVSGQQKTTWFSTSHEQPPRLLALSPSLIVAAPNFLQNLWPGPLEWVESMRGMDEHQEGRYYLRYHSASGATEFWGHVSRKPKLDFKKGRVGVVVPSSS
jgi:hypothetical protein